MVVATSASSSYAGTTTATVLPSSTKQRLPEERSDQADHEAEERGDDNGVPFAARRRLHRRRPGEHLRPFDLLGLNQQLLGLQLVVEDAADLNSEDGLRDCVTCGRCATDGVDLGLVVGD